MMLKRRTFLKKTAIYGAGMGALGSLSSLASTAAPGTAPFFKISLAQWSLHKTLFARKLDNLDFPAKAKNDFGIAAVEYVNQFFKDKATDKQYLGDLKTRAADHGVSNVLIMIDGEGYLGDTDQSKRKQAVEKHYKWVEAANFLGCHSIRVNAAGRGSAEAVAAAAVEGLGVLTEFAKDFNINIIVENHGGHSSNGSWLADVIAKVNMPSCGTLPDFGNFCIKRKGLECVEAYDRYKGTEELMPYAKGVSAKTHEFDQNGNEKHTDFSKIMKIVKDSGYTGYVGIEYEGNKMSENDGILATKKLLERVGKTL